MMNDYNHVVQFNSEELTIIKEDINQIWKQELTNWFKNLFISSKCIIPMYFTIIIAGLMLISTAILASLSKEDIINMLNRTIELFINSYVWISSLDLNQELNFHRSI